MSREEVEKKLEGPLMGFFYCPHCKKKSVVAHDSVREFMSDDNNLQSCCGSPMLLITNRNMFDEEPGTKAFDRAIGNVLLEDVTARLEEAEGGCPCCIEHIRHFVINSLAQGPPASFVTAMGRAAIDDMRKQIDRATDEESGNQNTQ